MDIGKTKVDSDDIVETKDKLLHFSAQGEEKRKGKTEKTKQSKKK